MEENRTPDREEIPGEVIEVYRPADPREVVESYRCPLPGYFRRAAARTAPPKKKSRVGLWVFLLLLAAAALLAGGAWVLNQRHEEKPPVFQFGELEFDDELEIEIPRYEADPDAALHVTRARAEKLTPQEIYRQVNPAAVTVLTRLEDGKASVGTGVIFRSDGYILTNYHVVEGGQDCVIMLDNDYTFPAQYVAGDRDNDLAVLKSELTELPTAVFGDSDQLTVGDTVYAIGNPLGVELRGTFTNGIVSAMDRDVQVDGRSMNLIQTNAALNSGNSGGPLIDEYGRVVGINVIKMTARHESAPVEGLGFAIPSAAAERIVNDLLTFGELQPEPKLGVSVLQIADEVAQGVWGLEVVEVVPDSAAQAAGVQVGDYVLRAAGEETLTSQDLLRVRRRCHIGDQLTLTLWRDGKEVEATLDLQEPFE